MYDVVHISDSNESFIFIEMFADFTTFKIDSKHAGFFPFLNICANRNAKKRVVVKTVKLIIDFTDVLVLNIIF